MAHCRLLFCLSFCLLLGGSGCGGEPADDEGSAHDAAGDLGRALDGGPAKDVSPAPDGSGPADGGPGADAADAATGADLTPDAGPGPARPGEPCPEPDPARGHCVEGPDGWIYTSDCESLPCPGGWTCAPVPGPGGCLLSLCVPPKGWLCSSCTDDVECAGPRDRCVPEDEQSFCGGDCSLTGWCPSGWTCDAERGEQCVPVEGRWCDPCEDRPRVRWCADLDGDDHGDLRRTETTCDAPAEGYVIDCDDCDDGERSVHPGAAERCNGVDDDCDGATDEDLGVGQGCAAGVGACRSEGVWECAPQQGGGLLRCSATPGEPSEEVCDGADNDCNGTVDDPPQGCECLDADQRACGSDVGECQPGLQRCSGGRWALCEGGLSASPELCDGLDNDCDGAVDNTARGCECLDGQERACGTEVGECERGQQACVDGRWAQCAGGVSPAAELCDGLDNDCNGVSDDRPGGCACVDGDRRECGSAVGECRPGTERCQDGAWGEDCEGAVEPQPEVCDGLDNDCTGLADEGFWPPCECPAGTERPCGVATPDCEPDTQRCPNGFWSQCERCDGRDNDCDGAVDEIFGLGLPCSAGLGACRARGETACRPDGLHIACAAEPAPGAAEACDGVDNDCDGFVDEDAGCPLRCPDDMVLIAGRACMDVYEASRADATDRWGGRDELTAPVAQPGLIPWYPTTVAVAGAACAAAGKRLCTPEEWTLACRGPDDHNYSYGDLYVAHLCNGIDAFCLSPRQWCRRDDGASFHCAPAGSFPDCTNGYGVYDINGNVWEYDSEGNARGGAYNCGDSEWLHQCSQPMQAERVSAKGFRCCRDPE